MTTNTIIMCLEEAAILGYRFPDLPESDVLEHVSDIARLSSPIQSEWAVARCVMAAYEHENVLDGLTTAKAWGIVPENTEYDSNKIYHFG